MRVEIAFACNHWKNGEPLGHFEAVNVTGELFEYIEIECMRTSIDHASPNAILRVGRVQVPYVAYTSWLGNWCWDGFSVTVEDCARVLNYLRTRRGARCIGGPTGLFERFDEDAPLTEQQIVEALT